MSGNQDYRTGGGSGYSGGGGEYVTLILSDQFFANIAEADQC